MSQDLSLGRRIRRELIKTLWQQPIWAIPFALFFGTLYGSGWSGYGFAYVISLTFAFTIRICIETFELFLLPRLRRARRPGAFHWSEAIGFTVASLVGSYVAALIMHFTIVPGFLGNARAVAISGAFAMLFTVLIGGVTYAITFYRQAVERARAVEQARAELAQAEVRALRAQIHPHFLFNTLNTIASLIAENPRAAEETTTRLADVFRYTLRASEREEARLGDELAFLRAYLDIERTRFGDRLRVVESIEPGLDSVPVPSLLLQPVVENAVRHGVASRPEGGTVTLTVRRDAGTLVVEIGDDGPGFDRAAASSGAGFGLHSVRERLRNAGPPHALTIASEPGRGSVLRITLPLRETPPPV